MTAQQKQILNRYRLIESKGKGGFGTVDVAWDSRLQRRVAIKRIPLSSKKTTLPGIQEARTAALLNEPHIVSVLDFEVTSSEAMIIMENVDGPTLGTLLEESTELLDLDTIASIVSDVAAALEYAHENQVLHLDIKPDNILIDHKGNIKVTDFGLSELSGTAGFSEPQGGTIGYMPPEQIEQQEIDPCTDLWALAMVLYLLLTGENPFQADTSSQSLDLIFNSDLVSPSEYREDLNPAADEVIIRALMANKEQRYHSVQEFCEAIAVYLGSVQKGRRNLKFLVNNRDLDEIEFTERWHQEQLVEDDEEEFEDAAPIGSLWERAPRPLRGFLSRLLAAVACGSFAFVGLTSLNFLWAQAVGELQLLMFLGILALVAVAAFLSAKLGSALASAILITGVFARGLIFIGAALAILLAFWWAFAGRRSRAESVLVMLTPLFGALYLGFALPLLSGSLLNWRHALLNSLTQALVLIAIAAMGTAESLAHTNLLLSVTVVSTPATVPELLTIASSFTDGMYAFLQQPQTWICLVAFLLATLIMGLFMNRYSRLRAVMGLLLAVSIILLATVLAPTLLSIDISFASLTDSIIDLLLSFILLLAVLLVGVSTEAELEQEQIEEL